MKKTQKRKLCPLLDRACEGKECEVYNEILKRCEIGVIAYNLYRVSEALRRDIETRGEDPEDSK